MPESLHKSPAPATPEEQEGFDLHVLLADDNPDILNLSKMRLEMLGCKVVAVENGPKLLDKLASSKEGEFGLVITDKEMPPNLNGIEVILQIRKDPRFNKLALILSTGDEGNKHIDRPIVEAAGGTYLSKPFRPEELSGAIKKALKQANPL